MQAHLQQVSTSGKGLGEAEYRAVAKYALSYLTRNQSEQSVAYFRDVVEPELKLLQNPRFVAFVADLAVNSTGTHQAGSGANIPVLDRFRDLLVSLHSPGKRFPDLEKSLMRDMAHSFGISGQQ